VANQVDRFEAAYIDGDKLLYQGYDVERSSDAADHQSFATIKKNGRFNRPGAKVSEGLRDSFLLQASLASVPNVYDCIKAFGQTDFTEDLKKFDVPTLIVHGDDDQVVPIAITALVSSKIVKGATVSPEHCGRSLRVCRRSAAAREKFGLAWRWSRLQNASARNSSARLEL
jgi:pimeloyl-ACP methyl ester carboxylesterase